MPTATRRATAPSAEPSLIKTVRAKQNAIFVELDGLGKKYGADVFRIAGQRYFKRQREEAVLREQIAEREAELARLRRKAGG
jgi:hypothetical protein